MDNFPIENESNEPPNGMKKKERNLSVDAVQQLLSISEAIIHRQNEQQQRDNELHQVLEEEISLISENIQLIQQFEEQFGEEMREACDIMKQNIIDYLNRKIIDLQSSYKLSKAREKKFRDLRNLLSPSLDSDSEDVANGSV